MTVSEDPWGGLGAPTDPSAVNARRVDETGRWNFYWGRDFERRCVLVLRHEVASSPGEALPRFRGIEVVALPGGPSEMPSLVFRLLDPSLHDVFLELCHDIMESAAKATTELQAVVMALGRTWRWHHLVRGGGSGLLSREEQKGLLAELLVLEGYLLPALPAAMAVQSWRGPLHAAKDFVIGGVAVECKAHAVGGPPVVLMSSEYQLDDTDLPGLFLHVSTFRPADDTEGEGFTVTQVASRMREKLVGEGQLAEGRFAALLEAAGFRFEDDYSGNRWAGGERAIYRIGEGFPRLVPRGIPAGISHVKYALSLKECAEYTVASDQLKAALDGANDGT